MFEDEGSLQQPLLASWKRRNGGSLWCARQGLQRTLGGLHDHAIRLPHPWFRRLLILLQRIEQVLCFTVVDRGGGQDGVLRSAPLSAPVLEIHAGPMAATFFPVVPTQRKVKVVIGTGLSDGNDLHR